MSGWDDVDKPSGGTGNGRFVQFEDDKPVRLRCLDEEPYTTRVHKLSQNIKKGDKAEEVFRSIPATSNPDDSFILKHNPKRYPEMMQFNMRVLVYGKDDSGKHIPEGEIRILQGGPAIFKALRTIYQNEGSLTEFDVIITRKGKGRDTEYTVSAAARSLDLNVKDIIAKVAGDPDLQWDRVFMPITGEQQKKIVEEAGMDINYDPAAALASSMDIDRAKSTILTMGKYKGKTVGDLMVMDPGYLTWAGESITSNDELAAACRVVDHHLRNLSSAAEPTKIAEKSVKPDEPKAEKPAPKAETKAEPAKPTSGASAAELKQEITDWFDSAPRFEDVQEVVSIIKKHGEGKTRLKDLTVGQMESLLAELKAAE